jgi:hypothetical protein
MTDSEETMLLLLQEAPDANTQAVLLQSYIAATGPLKEEFGAAVRKLLNERNES